MSIEKLIKETIAVGLEIKHKRDLVEELTTLIVKDIYLDEMLFAVGKDSEPPLPAKLYEFSLAKENVEVTDFLLNVFKEILIQFEEFQTNLSKIKRLIEATYGISYENEIYQEPWLEWRETKKQLSIFQEITLYYFSKIIKTPPPKHFLENKIYS